MCYHHLVSRGYFFTWREEGRKEGRKAGREERRRGRKDDGEGERK